MIAREAVLGDPEVLELLRTRFVPLAVDNVANPDLTPAEKEFLTGFDSGIKASTLGFSAFTEGGQKLGSAYDFRPAPIRDMLKKAIREFRPESGGAIVKGDPLEARSIRPPPEGGLIVYVTWKTLGDEKPEGSLTTGNGKYDKLFQESLGTDRMWVRKDEAAALILGEFPESLARRIARFHLRYVMSGDGRTCELKVQDGKLEGSFIPDGSGTRALALGHLESKGGRITRFDLMIKGWAKRVEDHGFSANLSVIPKGKSVPVALYFELADPSEGLARVLPRRLNDESYLR